MDTKRAYRLRFYPTPEQATILARTFGCARFVYNHMLQLRRDAWETRQESISYIETSAALTEMKQLPQFEWLRAVSSVPLQQSLRHLHTAYTNFFARRANKPRFKSKTGKQSLTYTDASFTWDGKFGLKLAKMTDNLPIRWSRTIPKAARVRSVTVIKDSSGRYFISLLCDDAVSPMPEVEKTVGIDLGLHDFAVLSDGEHIAAPRIFRKHEARLATLQRRVSKKEKGSRNRRKAQLKVNKVYARIADTRRDFLHKLSSRIIHENQVVVVESLAVSNMLKNRRLSKSIGDAGWGEFIRQLGYKALWYGRKLVEIARWFPSSKLCGDCGHIVAELPLNIREWTCPSCGSRHNRDENAARNIRTAGLAGIVCGEDVSPEFL